MLPEPPHDPSTFHAFEHRGWQRAAEYYPDAFGSLTPQAIAPLLEAVALTPGMRLLDVATGPGYVAGAAADGGARVVGVDFSRAMVAQARRRFPRVTFHEADAEALPFASGRFDAVVMNFGLLHLSRPEAALAEASRVLRAGGRCAFTVWAADAVAFSAVLRAIETHGTLDVPLPAGPPFFRFSEDAECRRTLEAAGLTRPAVRRLPIVWRLRSAGEVFEAISRGGVRTAAILAAQRPEALAAIHRDVNTAIERYARDGAIEVPMPVVLASARKPALSSAAATARAR